MNKENDIAASGIMTNGDVNIMDFIRHKRPGGSTNNRGSSENPEEGYSNSMMMMMGSSAMMEHDDGNRVVLENRDSD